MKITFLIFILILAGINISIATDKDNRIIEQLYKYHHLSQNYVLETMYPDQNYADSLYSSSLENRINAHKDLIKQYKKKTNYYDSLEYMTSVAIDDYNPEEDLPKYDFIIKNEICKMYHDHVKLSYFRHSIVIQNTINYFFNMHEKEIKDCFKKREV